MKTFLVVFYLVFANGGLVTHDVGKTPEGKPIWEETHSFKDCVKRLDQLQKEYKAKYSESTVEATSFMTACVLKGGEKDA